MTTEALRHSFRLPAILWTAVVVGLAWLITLFVGLPLWGNHEFMTQLAVAFAIGVVAGVITTWAWKHVPR